MVQWGRRDGAVREEGWCSEGGRLCSEGGGVVQ